MKKLHDYIFFPLVAFLFIIHTCLTKSLIFMAESLLYKKGLLGQKGPDPEHTE